MRLISLGAMLCGAMLGVTAAWGAPGDYDLSFGDRGALRAPFPWQALGQAIARQADGKLLAAGVVHPDAAPTQSVLVRFLDDGTVDTSFGNGGVAAVNAVSPLARSILVQGDGKIVVVAGIYLGGNNAILLVRYDAQGHLDPGFGTGGITSTPLPAGAQRPTEAVLQDDGKIVVASAANGDVLVFRYDTGGSLDAGFGVGGVATVDLGFADGAAAIVRDPVGIVVLGRADDAGMTYVALARVDDAGALDPTFGNAGTILHDIGSGAPPQTMMRLDDGELFVTVGGYVGDPATFTGAFFARLTATGTLDPTFGAGGVLADASEYVVTDLARTPDGKIVGVSTTGYAIVVERFELDGTHDETFGDEGEVETAIQGTIDYPEDVVVAPDGKIAVTGAEYGRCEPMNCDEIYHLSYNFFVARFQGGPAPCTSDSDCGPCESCGTAGGCVFGPRTSCVPAQPHGASIQFTYKPGSDDLDTYRIRFKWRGTTPFGFDPLASDDVGMCIYVEGERALRTVALAGSLCGGVPCWKGHPGSYLYRDRARSSDGIEQLRLASTKASVDASGVNLAKAMHDVLLPSSPEVLAQEDILTQVHGGNGQCLQATLSDFKLKFKPLGGGVYGVAGRRGVGQ